MRYKPCAVDQRGFAVVLVLGLIAALTMIALFALEQARREQQFAHIAVDGLQVEQSCLSLGSSLIRLFADRPLADWPTLTGDWCLGENAQLSQTCPGEFAGVENEAEVSMPDATHLEIISSARAHGIACGEEIELVHHGGEVLVSKRLRTGN